MSILQHIIKPHEVVITPPLFAQVMGVDPNDIPEPYAGIIQEEIELINSYENIRGGYRTIEKMKLDLQNSLIILDETTFHPGKQVVHYLKHSEMLAFFICTAGPEITHRSQKFMADGQYLEGYIADLAGSILVEAAMDQLHARLKSEMETEGLNITNRYSPGYCSWDVAEQTSLFSLFPENFCGVTLSHSALMHPIKSVSGVIGVGKNVRFKQYVCHACPQSDCMYRKIEPGAF